MPTRATAPTLDRIRAICQVLGDPERAFPVVHLTGTNGKGSVARMLSALFMANGLSVGTYTSPNLARVNERLARDEEPIADEELVEVLGVLEMVAPMVPGRATRFELLTAAAFWWFADVAVDVAVVEVGLGGRWDATNVVEPAVVAVTNVSYDHVEILGPTLADIAVGAGSSRGRPLPNCAMSYCLPPRLQSCSSHGSGARSSTALQTIWRSGDGCST